MSIVNKRKIGTCPTCFFHYSPPPISWTACPYCGVGAHQQCKTTSGKRYSFWNFHVDRIKAAKKVAEELPKW